MHWWCCKNDNAEIIGVDCRSCFPLAESSLFLFCVFLKNVTVLLSLGKSSLAIAFWAGNYIFSCFKLLLCVKAALFPECLNCTIHPDCGGYYRLSEHPAGCMIAWTTPSHLCFAFRKQPQVRGPLSQHYTLPSCGLSDSALCPEAPIAHHLFHTRLLPLDIAVNDEGHFSRAVNHRQHNFRGLAQILQANHLAFAHICWRPFL